MEKNNSTKLIAIIGLVVAVAALAVGFAAYSATLTIENAQAELNKINESLQKKDIEQSYKELIAEAFGRLTNNLKNNENIFEQEIEEIADLVHQATNLVQSTNKQLSRLKQAMWPQIRPPKVQAWINESSLALDSTIHDASKDNNPIASLMGNVMKRLNS